ncbi:MAG: pyridoxamine 5'-phosphate oxidase family protein [Candidatus Theseobacter exili]|nr:pyridoxamine 5'-phosphate oxidase family protein [Candidatus Theseobacter exili]
MRRKEQEIKGKVEIEKTLRDGIVCRLGLNDNGKTYIVPLNYGYSDGCLYFHSAKKGKKIDLIKKNNYACFEIEETVKLTKSSTPCNWGTDYKSIIGYGHINLIDDNADKVRCLNIIMAHYSDSAERNWTYNEPMLNAVALLKLNIEEMTGKKSD